MGYSELAGSPVEAVSTGPMGEVTYQATRVFIAPWDERFSVVQQAESGALSTIPVFGSGTFAVCTGVQIEPADQCVNQDPANPALARYQQARITLTYRGVLFWNRPLGPVINETLVPEIATGAVYPQYLYFTDPESGKLKPWAIPDVAVTRPVVSLYRYTVTYGNLTLVPPIVYVLTGTINSTPLTIMGGTFPIGVGQMRYTGASPSRTWQLATVPKWNLTLEFQVRGYDWNKLPNPVSGEMEYAYIDDVRRRRTKTVPFLPYTYADLRVLLP